MNECMDKGPKKSYVNRTTRYETIVNQPIRLCIFIYCWLL